MAWWEAGVDKVEELLADVGGDGLRVRWVEPCHRPGRPAPCFPTGRWWLGRVWLVVDKLVVVSSLV